MRTLLAALLLLVASAAHAQQGCQPYPHLALHLAEAYGMQAAWSGLTVRGHMLVTFEDDAGRWRSVLVLPNGMACPHDEGSGGGPVKAEPRGEPS